MSQEQEASLREQITRDMTRAADAIAALRGRALTAQQSENLAMADDFLRSARASSGTDLTRAGTLAEKARVLAEDLKSEVLK